MLKYNFYDISDLINFVKNHEKFDKKYEVRIISSPSYTITKSIYWPEISHYISEIDHNTLSNIKLMYINRQDGIIIMLPPDVPLLTIEDKLTYNLPDDFKLPNQENYNFYDGNRMFYDSIKHIDVYYQIDIINIYYTKNISGKFYLDN